MPIQNYNLLGNEGLAAPVQDDSGYERLKVEFPSYTKEIDEGRAAQRPLDALREDLAGTHLVDVMKGGLIPEEISQQISTAMVNGSPVLPLLDTLRKAGAVNAKPQTMLDREFERVVGPRPNAAPVKRELFGEQTVLSNLAQGFKDINRETGVVIKAAGKFLPGEAVEDYGNNWIKDAEKSILSSEQYTRALADPDFDQKYGPGDLAFWDRAVLNAARSAPLSVAQMLPQVAVTALRMTPGVGLAVTAAGIVVNALMMGGDTAVQIEDELRKQGLTPEDIRRAADWKVVATTGIPQAAMEYLGNLVEIKALSKAPPLSDLLKPKGTKNLLRAGRVAGAAATSAVGEGMLEETSQQLINNLGVKFYAKPDQDVWEGVPQAAAAGVIMGGTMGAAGRTAREAPMFIGDLIASRTAKATAKAAEEAAKAAGTEPAKALSAPKSTKEIPPASESAAPKTEAPAAPGEAAAPAAGAPEAPRTEAPKTQEFLTSANERVIATNRAEAEQMAQNIIADRKHEAVKGDGKAVVMIRDTSMGIDRGVVMPATMVQTYQENKEEFTDAMQVRFAMLTPSQTLHVDPAEFVLPGKPKTGPVANMSLSDYLGSNPKADKIAAGDSDFTPTTVAVMTGKKIPVKDITEQSKDELISLSGRNPGSYTQLEKRQLVENIVTVGPSAIQPGAVARVRHYAAVKDAIAKGTLTPQDAVKLGHLDTYPQIQRDFDKIDFSAIQRPEVKAPTVTREDVGAAGAKPAAKPKTEAKAAPVPTNDYERAVARLAARGIDVKTLSREDYMSRMAEEGVALGDEQLRKSRNLRDTEDRVGNFTDKQLTSDLNDNADAINSGAVTVPGVKLLDQTMGWVHYGLNLGTRAAGKIKSSGTAKLYLTFNTKDIARVLSPLKFNAFMAALASAGVNGQIKHAASSTALGSFDDQVVIHGASREDVAKAQKIAESFYGKDLAHISVGVDPIWGSYSQHLAALAGVLAGKPYTLGVDMNTTKAQLKAKVEAAMQRGEFDGRFTRDGMSFEITAVTDPVTGKLVRMGEKREQAPTLTDAEQAALLAKLEEETRLAAEAKAHAAEADARKAEADAQRARDQAEAMFTPAPTEEAPAAPASKKLKTKAPAAPAQTDAKALAAELAAIPDQDTRDAKLNEVFGITDEEFQKVNDGLTDAKGKEFDIAYKYQGDLSHALHTRDLPEAERILKIVLESRAEAPKAKKLKGKKASATPVTEAPATQNPAPEEHNGVPFNVVQKSDGTWEANIPSLGGGKSGPYVSDSKDEVVKTARYVIQQEINAGRIKKGKTLQSRGKNTVSSKNASTPAADKEYLGLATRYKAGDTSVLPQLETMVEAAAKAAGYVVKAFHGTMNSFRKFSTEKLGSKNIFAESANEGFFFGENRATAEAYTHPTPLDLWAFDFNSDPELAKKFAQYKDAREKIEDKREKIANELRKEMLATDQYKEVFAKLRVLFPTRDSYVLSTQVIDAIDTTVLGHSFDDEFIKRQQAAGVQSERDKLDSDMAQARDAVYLRVNKKTPKVLSVFLREENPYVFDYAGAGKNTDGLTAHIKRAKVNGNDAAIFKNLRDGAEEDTIHVVFSPEQIKSADPVTYDEQGNIIPLSERFNDGTADMYRSTGPAATVSIQGNLGAVQEVVANYQKTFGPLHGAVFAPAGSAPDANTKGEINTETGKVTIFLENIASPEELFAVIGHEDLAHKVLPLMLGDTWANVLEAAAKSKHPAWVAAREYVRENYGKLTPEEVVAAWVTDQLQNNAKPTGLSLFGRVLSAIKNFIYQTFTGSKAKMKDSEIISQLKTAMDGAKAWKLANPDAYANPAAYGRNTEAATMAARGRPLIDYPTIWSDAVLGQIQKILPGVKHIRPGVKTELTPAQLAALSPEERRLHDMMESPDVRDLGKMAGYFFTPWHLAKKFAPVKAFVETMISKQHKFVQTIAAYQRLADAYIKATKEQRADADVLLSYGDANSQTFVADKKMADAAFATALHRKGQTPRVLSQESFEAYKSYRTVLDHIQAELVAKTQARVDELENQKQLRSQVLADQALKTKPSISMQDLKDLQAGDAVYQRLDELHSTESNALESMKNVVGYIPRMRDEGWHITYNDPKTGEPFRRVFTGSMSDTPIVGQTFSLAAKEQAEAFGRELIAKGMKPLTREEYNDRIVANQTAVKNGDPKPYPDLNFSNYFVIDESKATPEEAFRNTSRFGVSKMIETVLVRSDKKDIKAAKDLSEAIYFGRGFRQHLLHRQNAVYENGVRVNRVIQGYQTEDLGEVLSNYIAGYSAVTSKEGAALEFSRILGDLMKTNQSNLFSYLDQYIADDMRMNSNWDKAANLVSGMNFMFNMSFRVSTAAINLTQNYLFGAHQLAMKARELNLKGWHEGKAYAEMLSANKTAAEFLIAKGMSGTKEIDHTGMSPERAEEYQMLRYMLETSNLHSLVNEDLKTLAQSHSATARAYASVAEVGSFMFQKTEALNRLTAFLAAYRMLRGTGMAIPQSRHDAEMFSLDVNYPYEKWNQPLIFKGNEYMRVAQPIVFGLQSFISNAWQMLVMLDPRAAAGIAMTYVVVAGVPFQDILKWLYRWVREGRDLTKDMAAEYGETVADIFREGLVPTMAHGVFGAMPSLSQSLSMGPPPVIGLALTLAGVQKQTSGPFQSWMGNLVQVAQGQEDWTNIWPQAARGMYQAFDESIGGMKTASGMRFMADGEAVRITGAEGVMRFLGFNPMRRAQFKADIYEQNKTTARLNEMRRQLVDRYIDEPSYDASQAIEEFNTMRAELRSAYGNYIVTGPITPKTIANRRKGTKVADILWEQQQ